MEWNFDMSQAPKGGLVRSPTKRKGKIIQRSEYVSPPLWVAYDGNKTGFSRWLPVTDKRPVGRWDGFTPGKGPDAFIELPKHPNLTHDA